MKQCLTIAHRGAKAICPENTLLAFQKAVEMGCDGIELDVRLSSDGEIVVMHDETIDRTTNGKGYVNQLSFEELRGFLIDKTNNIPLLSEVFDVVNKKCFIVIELKTADCAEKVAHLIAFYVKKKQWQYQDFMVSSFDWNALQTINKLNKQIKLGVLTATDLQPAIDFALTINADSIHPYFHLLTKENCSNTHEKKLHIFAWTINEISDINKIINFGVDGIISDYPERVQLFNDTNYDPTF